MYMLPHGFHKGAGAAVQSEEKECQRTPALKRGRGKKQENKYSQADKAFQEKHGEMPLLDNGRVYRQRKEVQMWIFYFHAQAFAVEIIAPARYAYA